MKRVPRFSLGVSRSGLGTAPNKAHSAVYSHLTGTLYECKKTGMDAQARTWSQLSTGRGSSFHQAAPKTMDAAVPQAHQECCEQCFWEGCLRRYCSDSASVLRDSLEMPKFSRNVFCKAVRLIRASCSCFEGFASCQVESYATAFKNG